jgi:ferredoxin-NADP reductase
VERAEYDDPTEIASHDWRVQAAAVGALATFGEGSLALVSGPVGFVEELRSGLAMAGWPASAVRVERRAAAEAAGSAGPIVARSFHLDPGPVKDEAMAFLALRVGALAFRLRH